MRVPALTELLCAGPCKYELHENDLQFEPLMEEYQALPEREREK